MPQDQPSDALKRELKAARARIRELEAGLIAQSSFVDPYRSLFDNSADAILLIDGGTFVDCNQATVDMLRYENKLQLLRTHPSELSPPRQPDGRDSFEKANEMIEIAFSQGTHRFEWNHKRADGEIFPVEVLLTPVPESGRTKLHVVWRDITERKQLESQLRQSQKMEAIGRLTGGIAHDFNNLLMVINGNTELLLAKAGDNNELSEIARQIGWAGARAAELTRHLLAFSRKQVLKPSILDMNKVLASVSGMLGRLIGENIQLVTQFASAPLMFKVDPGLIEQVIINLATNARDAMPHGGLLTITVERRDIDADEPSHGPKPKVESYAGLIVADDGMGMDEETQGRVFEPFFTTKALGKGTGLGLSTVHGMVLQSGGDIAIHSKPGEGTRVEVWFPVVDEPASEAEEVGDPVAGGAETILVVEDEQSVAAIVEKILLGEGYTVLVARDGVEALELFEAQPEGVDLVLSDVVMPRMGGPELIQSLRERGAEPVVIFVSGYVDDSLASTDQLDFRADYLQKPFRKQVLLHSIRRALDRGTDRPRA